VFPVLTPLAFDPGRPFPHISNLSLNLAVSIRDRMGNEHFARVKVPDSLPQLVPVSASAKAATKRGRPRRIDLVWLEQVIAAQLGVLFPGMEILEAHPFHVTRDADMAIKELEAEDLLENRRGGSSPAALPKRGPAAGHRGHARPDAQHSHEQPRDRAKRSLPLAAAASR